jgi:hypothetical protein
MKKLMFLVLVLCLVGSASAATFTGAVSNDWNTAGNWDPCGVPGAGAWNSIVADAVISSAAPATGQMNVAVWGAPVSVTVTSTGSITLDNSFVGNAGTGTLNISGTVTMTGQIRIGDADAGVLNMYEGSLLSTGWLVGCPFTANAASQSNLYGGTIWSNGPFSMNNTVGTANMDFEAGHLYFAGYAPTDATALVASYVADGRMTAYGGTGTVMYEFDTDAWKMHVWGVPEPMTICLLGLGGLFLRRRK